MSSETLSHDEAIGQFCGVTGADEERAKGLLEACDWNLELAINMHVDTDPFGRTKKKEPPTSVAGPSTSSNNETRPGVFNMNYEMDDRPETLCSNKDSDIQPARSGGRLRNGAPSTSHHEIDDDVRPPIAPVRQILNPSPVRYTSEYSSAHYARLARRTGGPPIGLGPPLRGSNDPFRDFQQESDWQEMMREEGSEDVTQGQARTLQDLFRPPLDLMFRGSLASAREKGSTDNRWLLVNVQNGGEFPCQLLNRDVWSNQTVRDIVKEHFIFWQVYHDSYEGQRYVQFYHVSKFPHVAIIDPRTGELVKSWPTKIDHNSFCDCVVEYLNEHPSPDGSSDASTMKKLRMKEEEKDEEHSVLAPISTLYDQSEEAQLEAAIKASLQEAEPKSDTCEDTIEIDDDTVEAFVAQDPVQIVRDRELIERSPPRENQKLPVKSEQQKQQEERRPPVEANDDNSKSNDTQLINATTSAADSLNAMAANMPVMIDGPCCKIALRFPDGSSLVRKFSAQERLQAVKLFVQMERSAANASNIEFVAPPNRKLTKMQMNETLESLGLCPASRLEVKHIQD